MVAPNKTKSRTYRRIHVTTPGGNKILHYKRRKPKAAHCACGAVLKGVPRELPTFMQNMPKTQKRPDRPFGGVLCTRCMRKKIINSVLEA
jgi:large subunit ribosomal protein L34e